MTFLSRTIPSCFLPILSAGLLLLASPAVLAQKTAKKQVDKDAITWLTPSEGEALAKKNGKPILYDFTAAWCGYCRILDKLVFSNPKHAKRIAASFVTVRVLDRRREEGKNKPEVDEWMRAYAVRGFPTLAVRKAEGVPVILRGFAGEKGTMRFLENNGMK